MERELAHAPGLGYNSVVGGRKSVGLVLEGSWEDVLAHSDELAGKRVKVEVLAEAHSNKNGPQKGAVDADSKNGKSILDYFGAWVGDDLGE
jgi:hypothetical protein